MRRKWEARARIVFAGYKYEYIVPIRFSLLFNLPTKPRDSARQITRPLRAHFCCNVFACCRALKITWLHSRLAFPWRTNRHDATGQRIQESCNLATPPSESWARHRNIMTSGGGGASSRDLLCNSSSRRPPVVVFRLSLKCISFLTIPSSKGQLESTGHPLAAAAPASYATEPQPNHFI